MLRLLQIALLAETGYAVLNISAMPVYLKFDRHFGAAIISLVLVAFLLSEAVFKGPMGHIADRIGFKRMIVMGPALTFCTALCTLLVPHEAGVIETGLLVILRALDGLGAAMLWPAAFALMGASTSDGERQQAMSLLNTCYLIGVGVALPVGGAANDLLGYYFAEWTGERSPSLFLAALLFASVSLSAWRKLPSGADQRAAHEVEEHSEFKLGEFLASTRRIPAYLLLGIVTFAGIGFPMPIIKLFAEQQFGMSEAKFGLLVLPGAAAMALLSVPMSRYGERLGKYRAVHLGMGLCVVGLAIISLGAFLPLFRQAWVLALGGIPVGLGFLLAIPAWFASVSEIDPKRRAANLGAVMTSQGVGAIVGAPLGGLMYEKLQPFGESLGMGADFGRYSPFLGCVICVFFGWLIGVRLLHEPKPTPERSSE